MKVLVVKTSSMGDVLHTLPALGDAQQAFPDIRFDWVVEEAFAEIPGWHPAVDRVIPVALRRWRKQVFATLRSEEWKAFKAALQSEPYDAIIDAQGLLKSAWMTRIAKGPVYGLDWSSVREPLASLFYNNKIAVAKDQHAVTRVRQLFARSLGYAEPTGEVNYRIAETVNPANPGSPRLVFLHATTRADKHWPEGHWAALCKRASEAGYTVALPWADEEAKQRAQRLASVADNVEVLPRLDLAGIASELRRASGVVAVDTGLGHMTAALDVPCVSLYCATDPARVGAYGQNQRHLQTQPPFASLTPDRVWSELSTLMAEPDGQG